MVANLEPLVKREELDLDLVNKFVNAESDKLPLLEYDREYDALFVFFEGYKKRYVAEPLNRWMSFLFDPKTKIVFGMQITGFEKSFIAQYPELKESWRISKFSGKPVVKANPKIHMFKHEPKPVITQELREITESFICV